MSKILEMIDIYKRFGSVSVLKGIDFCVEKGEVRALLGANGAGKSTLMKVIGGVHSQTKGRVLLNGKEINFKNPHHSKENGISVIYQELSLVPTLTVVENIFLGREITNGVFINKKAMLNEYENVCNEFDFNIDPYTITSKLSIANQQMIEIMKAVSANSDIIIMDEPTTSLTNKEKESLFKIIGKLKSMNKTIIYISHILEEVFRVCDSASIMKNGEMVGTYKVSDLTKLKITQLMTGNENHKIIETKDYCYAKYDEAPILQAKNLRNSKVKDISFDIYKGEIVGLAGLVGSRRTEIINILFGIDKKENGEIFLNNKKVNIASPKEAISNKIGLIPEDRKNLGLILDHPIYTNSAAVQIDRFKNGIFISKNKEIEFSESGVENLGIKVNNVKQYVKELSGGNQQKVVVSKWLEKDLDLIVYDEPTKGIDIAAKEDIFKTVEAFAKTGMGVIFISSDLEEVIRISDRILVVREGAIVDQLKNDGITVQDIMNSIFNVH
ncbi:sugar ABC transporter ATP-binding protein [Terrisporobacter hibernicus]|uniref:Sugar ABC transporter ATP-binding protein n=1 Tax=Terrisporobacter hibernicus TaxID=2813371 RepID=A0AAX2ZHE2_9FIRM|nr:sugar ABC transporter ATP-binding protein [Terrisporobacter hibernicus]UEL47885.1 sugar ABC transporter ATP-binding protein [Terrisporobacter hibernicus]